MKTYIIPQIEAVQMDALMVDFLDINAASNPDGIIITAD